MKLNYQKELEDDLEKISKLIDKPRLLLHACCAPCSSYVIEYLCEYFDITIFFYNPNIYPETEYNRRFDELKKFIKEFKPALGIQIIHESYSQLEFANCSIGLENSKEGGQRCFNCYDLRLSKTAEKARELKFDYFTTTLTISPHKNSEKINEIGSGLSKIYEVKFLHSDFKKKEGFKRSLELSKEFDLYRQDYCGCEYSMNENFQE